MSHWAATVCRHCCRQVGTNGINFVRQTLPPLVKRWQVKCLMRVRLLAGIVQG
jgi:hypothetical protein